MKINLKNLLFTILLIPFFKPSAFVNYVILDSVFDLLRVVSIIIVVSMILTEVLFIKKYSYSKTQLFLWIYTIYMLIITIIL